MVDEQKTQIPKIAIVRSARFPSISLDYAVGVITEASKFGQSITNTHIAGNGATDGGAFNRKRASLGYYGLIEGRDGKSLHITELAMRIANPLTDEERLLAIQESYLHPELFKKLYQGTAKRVPIQISILGNLLVREYGIQPSAKNEFLSTFIKSGVFAHLISYKDSSKTEIVLEPRSEAKEEKSQELVVVPESPTEPMTNVSSLVSSTGTQIVELSLENGQARLIVPKVLTSKDAKKLKAQINILADIFNDAE